MRRNLKLLTISLSLAVLLCSCSLFPSPNDALGPPKKNKNISAKNKDVSSIVNAFLPEGSILLEPINKNIKPIHEIDLDKDGKNEILVSYKSDKKMIQSGFMILKIKGDVWDKAYEDNNDYLLTKDIIIYDEKNHPIILLLRSNVSQNEFKAISWTNNSFNDAFNMSGGISISQFEIKDLAGVFGMDGREELIIKTKNNNDDSIGFLVFRPFLGYLAGTYPTEFPEFTMEEIKYYQDKLKENPDKYVYYLNLYINQLELDNYQDALTTLNNGLKANLSSQDKHQLMLYKAQMFIKLGKPIEAKKLFNELINASEDGNFIDNIMADIYILEKKYDKAREIYLKNSEYPYPDEIKILDEIIWEDKIIDYVNKNIGISNINSSDKLKGFEKFGTDNEIKITPVIPEYLQKSDNKVLFLKYRINSEKVHGRLDIGGSIIFWVNNGKLYHESFLNHRDGLNPFDISSAKFLTDQKGIPTISCVFDVDQKIASEIAANPLNPQFDKSLKTVKISYKLKNNKWIKILE